LVNNAGIGLYGPTLELDLQSCRNLFETNVIAVIAITQIIAPIMIKQKGGKIVNIASVAGILSTPFSGAYSASKAALRSWSDAMRLELAPFNIAVLTVDPGAIKSEISAKSNFDESFYLTKSLYKVIGDYVNGRARESQKNPTPTQEFADKTVSYILQSSPSSHFSYGRSSGLIRFVAYWLPYWLRDFILSRRFGLNKLKASVQADNSLPSTTKSE